MPTLLFVTHDGNQYEVEAAIGASVMSAAVAAGIDGILADCGGACSCATCHVYVDPAWVERLPPAEDMEEMTLEGALDPQPNSRLSCQVVVDGSMEGAIFHIPARQF